MHTENIEKMKVLIAGCTGYTGRNLTKKLLDEGTVSLRLLEWDPRRAGPELRGSVELVKGNTRDKSVMDEACRGIYTAYYLVNYIDTDPSLEKLNLKIARRFRNSCIKNGVKRIIYCSEMPASISIREGYQIRRKIGEVLLKYPDKIQTLWLRHGIVLGSGSLNFEILNALSERKKLLIFGWMRRKIAVIGVDDLAEVLSLAKNADISSNRSIDLYTESQTYDDLLKIIEKEKHLTRKKSHFRFNYKFISSLYLTIHTPVHFAVARELIERISRSLERAESVKKFFPDVKFHSAESAVKDALRDVEESVESCRWCDSYSNINSRIEDEAIVPSGILFDRREVIFDGLSPEAVFSSVLDTGGKNGWFSYTFLWQIRGLMDKFVGGYGLNRGKRNSRSFRVGDSIDVWKVADIQENRRLLLYAHMKLPGRGWLEFEIKGTSLVQTAYFEPSGIRGRLYWLLMLPFHGLIFNDMARKIIERAGEKSGSVN